MKSWIQKLKMRLPAVFLLTATLLFWSQYDRYEVTAPALLESASLANATRVRGDSTESNGCFVLKVPAGGKTASLNFRMPGAADHQLIRVSGRIKVTDVVEGKYRWSCARMLLTQYDENNKWISGKHGLVTERGTTDWEGHEDVFEIVPEAKNVDVVIQQIGRSGTAEFDQLRAEPVKLKASFLWWRIGFAGLWLFLAALYFRRCRLDRRKLRVLILLNALAILTGTLMPSEWISNTTEGLKEVVVKSLEQPQNSPAPVSEKATKEINRESKQIDRFNEIVGGTHRMGHFLLFASLCLLVYLSAALERQHPIYFLKVAGDLFLFAVITETLQYLTVDRTPGFYDWLTDVYGMSSAFVVFLLILVLRRIFAART